MLLPGRSVQFHARRSPKPTALSNPQLVNALQPAPMAISSVAREYPQSMRISSAAMLFTMTAQLTADALLGRSYSQTISSSGKSFVQLDTSSAVDKGLGCG